MTCRDFVNIWAKQALMQTSVYSDYRLQLLAVTGVACL